MIADKRGPSLHFKQSLVIDKVLFNISCSHETYVNLVILQTNRSGCEAGLDRKFVYCNHAAICLYVMSVI